MFEVVIALDKIGDHFEVESYASLLRDIEIANGYKITPATLLNETLIRALYWWTEFIQEPTFIMADMKLADVGVRKDGHWVGTNSEIIRSVCYTVPNVGYFTCHGFPGENSVQEAVDTAKEFGAEILLITNMTHEGSKQHMTFPDYFDNMIWMGEKCGVGGYIVPGNDLEAIERAAKMTTKEIWSPGFGRQVSLRGGPKIPIKEQIRNWQRLLLAREVSDTHLTNKAIIGSYVLNDDEPDQRMAEVKTFVCNVPKDL